MKKGPIRRFLDLSARVVLGHDLFISYRWATAKQYAAGLAERLEAGGLSCFIDVKDLGAGEELSPFLRRVLRRSTMMVVLATPDVTQSHWVRLELEAFLGMSRKVVPLSFGGAIPAMAKGAAPWSELAERRWLSEGDEAFALGEPSADVLAEIPTLFTYRRKKTLIAATLAGLSAVVLALGVVALFLGRSVASLNDERERTEDQLEHAHVRLVEAETRVASAQTDLAKKRREVDAVVSALAATRDAAVPRLLDKAAERAYESMLLAPTPEGESVLRSSLGRLAVVKARIDAAVHRPDFMEGAPSSPSRTTAATS